MWLVRDRKGKAGVVVERKNKQEREMCLCVYLSFSLCVDMDVRNAKSSTLKTFETISKTVTNVEMVTNIVSLYSIFLRTLLSYSRN